MPDVYEYLLYNVASKVITDMNWVHFHRALQTQNRQFLRPLAEWGVGWIGSEDRIGTKFLPLVRPPRHSRKERNIIYIGISQE